MTPSGTGSGKEVLLTVTGEEIYGDGRRESTRTCYRAVFEKTLGETIDGSGGPDSAVYTFRYREEDPGSGAATESVMKFSEIGCEIVRSGEIRVKMRFEPEKEHRCMYGTPYGDIPMTIRTRLVAVRETAPLNYVLFVFYLTGFAPAFSLSLSICLRHQLFFTGLSDTSF